MGRYDDLIDPTATAAASLQVKLAPRRELTPADTLVTIDNGKPGGRLLLRTIARAIAERRGVAIEERRKKGASTPYDALQEVVRPRTVAIGALGD